MINQWSSLRENEAPIISEINGNPDNRENQDEQRQSPPLEARIAGGNESFEPGEEIKEVVLENRVRNFPPR